MQSIEFLIVGGEDFQCHQGGGCLELGLGGYGW